MLTVLIFAKIPQNYRLVDDRVMQWQIQEGKTGCIFPGIQHFLPMKNTAVILNYGIL